MKQETLLSWKGNMEFETELNGHKLTLDASPESGGSDKDQDPKCSCLLRWRDVPGWTLL